nr:hypothetical protein [Bacillus coahuilensis]
MKQQSYEILFPEYNSGARLVIFERYFLINAWGYYDAEAYFF